MVALYIVSLAEAQGKTSLCATIGKLLQEKGQKVGYFKPLYAGQSPDKDTAFLKQALSLKEPVEQLSPLSLNDAQDNLEQKVLTAYNATSQGKDVVIIEGIGGLAAGGAAQATLKLIGILKAKVLLVAHYSDTIASSVQTAAKMLSDNLLGVVINAVPSGKLAKAKSALVAQLQEKRIRVLAVIPQHRSLFTVTVSELAESLSGKQLVPIKDSGGLVENLMMGALWNPDSALPYYARKANKAVMMRGDRSDMQLAAIQTSTRCLVLTGGKKPMSFITAEAGSKKVPVITIEADNMVAIEKIEALLKQARFHQQEKLDIMGQLLAQNFDFAAIRGLGLKA